jgi:polyhydroxyalkanoate synthesis repressor PhaR
LRTLKKYPNRRIYDTESSQFITLGDVRQMILARQPLRVIHSKSGADITRSVLLQIITELESEGHQSLLTDRVLEELIRIYGDSLAQLAGLHIEKQILLFLQEQDRLREHFLTPFNTP